jgi:hypothetical protein
LLTSSFFFVRVVLFLLLSLFLVAQLAGSCKSFQNRERERERKKKRKNGKKSKRGRLVSKTKTENEKKNHSITHEKLFFSFKKNTQPTVRAAGSGVYDKSRKYADIKEATAAGLDGACAPFPEGLDILGFCKGINGGDLQRFREAEITHGRVSMIATVGFLVGEQVEGSSFLFDAQVTGPAIDHFQQTPGLVWGLVGATIFLLESTRVQKGWSDPFTSELFSLNDDYIPGQWGFDPLGLSNNKTAEDMAEARLKEINNGRLAMISISGMVAQELVNGLNLIPADEVLEEGRGAALAQMGKQCAGAVDEAACAKAFEAAERIAVAAGN